jgi:hypothetical protein
MTYENADADLQLPDDVLIQRDNLENRIRKALSDVPVVVAAIGRNVTVHFQESLISGVSIEEECYKIYNASSDWKDTTTYRCDEADDGTWFYYLETIDECVGEIQRLVMFESAKRKKQLASKGQHTSELSKVVTAQAFEKAYSAFIEQADKNFISKKAQGSKVPFGFSEKPKCDGEYFNAKYGQGTSSATPYMNWWVVSIYYLPENGNIIIGIEEERYPHLKEMKIKPLRYDIIGNKKINTAVFYSTTKSNINYGELYESFLDVCEEVMKLGMQ